MGASMEKLTWGILSTAKIGMEKVIPAMLQGKLTKITAIASRDKAQAQTAADRFVIEKAYGSYEDVAKKTRSAFDNSP